MEARWYMERYTQSLMAKLNVKYLSTLFCILKLYIGETNSISLSVQEIFAKRLEGIESYLDGESESDNE